MKRILLILLLFVCVQTVKADIDLDLGDPFIRFDPEYDYYLQGFTIINNKLFLVMINDDEDKPKIKVFDLDTNEEVYTKIVNGIGHANDVTFNSKDNKIYIVHGNGLSVLHVFDADSYEYLYDVEIELPARSIAYIDDLDIYALRTVSSGYMINNEHRLYNKLPFLTGMSFTFDVGRQGWTYYKGYIYYSTWSWIRFGGDGSNKILVYDLTGKLRERLVTNDDIGELENVDFYKDKMILGINSYEDDFVEFYSIDIPEIEPLVEEDEEEETVSKKNYLWFLLIPILLIPGIIFIIKKRCK